MLIMLNDGIGGETQRKFSYLELRDLYVTEAYYYGD